MGCDAQLAFGGNCPGEFFEEECLGDSFWYVNFSQGMSGWNSLSGRNVQGVCIGKFSGWEIFHREISGRTSRRNFQGGCLDLHAGLEVCTYSGYVLGNSG